MERVSATESGVPLDPNQTVARRLTGACAIFRKKLGLRMLRAEQNLWYLHKSLVFMRV